jgi:hypothetical protein
MSVRARSVSLVFAAKKRTQSLLLLPIALLDSTSGLLVGGSRPCSRLLRTLWQLQLDLALALHAHRQVEISVINPRRARRFAESLGERSKTDPVDAHVLCHYAVRMPWVGWQPTSSLALRLRAITRAIESLGVMLTPEKNRAHALGSSQALPPLVLRERASSAIS